MEYGVHFFVWEDLDFVYKHSGYDPNPWTVRYDGKARIGEWILTCNKAASSASMGAALFTTGPYMQMTIASRTPMAPTIIDGVIAWRVPLGKGAVLHVDLDFCGHYVRWLFDNHEKANGVDLKFGIAHIAADELAKPFRKVTGKPARYEDVSFEEYWTDPACIAHATELAAHNSDISDLATMTFQQNFTGFWTMKESFEGITRS